MGHVVLYSWFRKPAFPRFREVFQRHAEVNGCTFEEINGCYSIKTEHKLLNAASRATQIFVHGGHKVGCDLVRRITCNRRIETFVFELGWMPQSEYLAIDGLGIIGGSALCGPLYWVTEEMMSDFRHFRENWRSRFGRWDGGSGGYILVPLQLPYDAAISLYSPFEDMHKFVSYIEQTFPNNKLIFKAHPLDQSIALDTSHAVIREGSVLKLAQSARLVVGINSTSLIESAMMGVPTLALGECPLRCHPTEIDRLLAAYCAHQFEPDAYDISPQLASARLARLSLLSTKQLGA